MVNVASGAACSTVSMIWPHGDVSLSQRGVQVRIALVVVQVNVPQPWGHRHDPIHGRRFADAGVGVAHIQAQPQSGIVYLGGDGHQRLPATAP